MHPLWNAIAQGTLADSQLSQLDAYLDRLIEKNRVLNLTRISDKADAEIRHVADALTLLAHLPPPGATQGRLADVGTGGGIPGVVLAIARPDLEVTLIDATRKKLDAVAEMCVGVGVPNVRTHHGRVEAMKPRLPFTVVTTRAVADVRKLVGYCRGLMGPASTLLAMKGPKAQAEIEEAAGALRNARMTASVHPVNVSVLEGHVIVRVARK